MPVRVARNINLSYSMNKFRLNIPLEVYAYDDGLPTSLREAEHNVIRAVRLVLIACFEERLSTYLGE